MPADSIQRPIVLYDGDCGFCKRHVSRWQARAGDAIEFAPYQDASARFPQLSQEQLSRAVHLIEPNGAVSSGAGAVFRMAAISRKRPVANWCYQHLFGF